MLIVDQTSDYAVTIEIHNQGRNANSCGPGEGPKRWQAPQTLHVISGTCSCHSCHDWGVCSCYTSLEATPATFWSPFLDRDAHESYTGARRMVFILCIIAAHRAELVLTGGCPLRAGFQAEASRLPAASGEAFRSGGTATVQPSGTPQAIERTL